jgi:capsular polysaccharide export protein
VDGRAVGTALADNKNFGDQTYSERMTAAPLSDPTDVRLNGPEHFLRIPPFPGARVLGLARRESGVVDESLVELICKSKVGGPYWAAQPPLPEKYVLVRGAIPQIGAVAAAADPLVIWNEKASKDCASVGIREECDPWHMLARATLLVTDAFDEVSVIASILGVPVQLFDGATGTLKALVVQRGALLGEALGETYGNPFTGQPMSSREAIELCAFWRRLIDSNRDLDGGFGFAFWKQGHVGPLLWAGGQPFRFLRSAREARPGRSVAVWRSRTSTNELASLQDRGGRLVEVEDGFLRSQGLGADCVPPLSITVDRLGAYFDPAQPSELELLIQSGEFDSELLARARKLRQFIVRAGLGKYERGDLHSLERPAGKRRHILVPGQVEDDRAVQTGGCGLVSNLDLLARVREQAPEAYILYKPHPDVLAGHRRGAMSDKLCLQHADEVVTDVAVSSLIDMADEIHVNTSLTGFEALLREKPVTTYGVPFYAGWGMTRDLGPVPGRRTARRSLDELVAAALLIYPRYLDPVTGLPCPAEVAVDRLATQAIASGLLVSMRRLQGKLLGGVKGLFK